MPDTPSLVVRVAADLVGLQNAVSGVATHAQNMAGKMGSAFSGVLGALNQTGVLGEFGTALDGVGGALDAIGNHGKTAGAVMAGVGAGIAGVGAALTAMGSKDQAAHQQLQAAVEATGHSYDDYSKQVDEAIKHQEHYGHTASETQDALRIMTQAMGDPAKALQYLGEASDLAAAKHESLDAAATQLSRTYNGANKLLKEFGVETLPKASAEQKILDSATKSNEAAVKAQALAVQHLNDVHALLAGKTHLTTAEQISLRDAQQKVTDANMAVMVTHNNLVTAQDGVSKSAHNAATTMQELGDKIKGQAAAQADTFKGKLEALKATVEDAAAKFGQKFGPALQIVGVGITAVGTAMTAGMGPILLIAAAVAALVVIGYLLYTNWSTIWHFLLDDLIKPVWNWIKDYWPLLLGILLGPIGIAVALIIKNFDTIKAVVMDAIDWVRNNWPLLVAILTGPIGIAAYLIIRNLSSIIDFFTGMPGRIASIASGMWDGIWQAFRAAINMLIDGWNSLQFKLPSIHFGPINIDGPTIGVPSIPHLAQGGIITQTGLVYAHAGEAITPAPARPAVHIDNVNVHDGADIDLLLTRIRFAATAGVL